MPQRKGSEYIRQAVEVLSRMDQAITMEDPMCDWRFFDEHAISLEECEKDSGSETATTTRARIGLDGAGSGASILWRVHDDSGDTVDENLGADYGNEKAEMHEQYSDEEHEELWVRVVARKYRTGLEPSPELEPLPGETLAARYVVTKELGAAAFSRGYRCTDVQDGLDVCVKILGSTKEWMDQGLDEARVLRLCNAHDPDDLHGIVRLHDIFYTREHLCVVSELLGPSLHDVAERDCLPVARSYSEFYALTQRLLDALAFLHSLGIAHCDVKPENVLMASDASGLDKCKLIDYGGACFVAHDKLGSYVQSRPYRAPEVLQRLDYGCGVDVWSLGCVLFEAATREVLFESDNNSELLARMHSLLGGESAHVPELVDGKRGLQLHSVRNRPWYMKSHSRECERGSAPQPDASAGDGPANDMNEGASGSRSTGNESDDYIAGETESVDSYPVELVPKPTSLVQLLRDCACEYADEAAAVISQMLVVNAHERPTAERLLQSIRSG